MCITSAKAKLSKTRIMSMALDNGRHLLSYSNKAKNLSGKVNSMILPVPGKVNRDWFHNTTDYNDFLGDIEDQAYIEQFRSRGMASNGIDRGFLSFDEFQVGFYKVVTTDNIEALREHLNTLDESQRPDISDELLDFFKEHYGGWSFVICIFSGDKEMDAQPIMFEYEPVEFNYIYFPMMDGHNGGAPDLTGQVSVDHTLIVDFPGLEEDMVRKVKFEQEVPEVLKRRKFVSTKWKQSMRNGDMYVDLGELTRKSKDASEAYSFFMRKASHPCRIEVQG